MSSYLPDCPEEIVNEIAKLLELHDICSLRLASRLLAFKTHHHFQSFFHSKKVPITRGSLLKFMGFVKYSPFCTSLQELKLVGIVNNTKRLAERAKHDVTSNERARAQRDLDILTQRREDLEHLHRSGGDLILLCEAFAVLAKRRTRRLCIHLSVEVYRRSPNWPERLSKRSDKIMICQAAADTFHTTMRALLWSRLPVEAMSCFQHAFCCSVACNDIDRAFEPDTRSQPSLVWLGLSISDRAIRRNNTREEYTGDSADEIDGESAEDARPQSERQAEADDEHNFTGILQLFSRFPKLMNVDLRYFCRESSSTLDYHRHLLLQRVVEASALPRLSRLTLRGFLVRCPDLLALIEGRPLNTLILKNVRLIGGSFSTIFTACMEKDPQMEQLYFKDLFEDYLVCFNEPGQTRDPDAAAIPTDSILKRSGAEVRREISYHVRDGIVPGNVNLQYAWKYHRRKMYGQLLP